jgi:Flp pilus assembly protein TadG
MGLKRTRNGRRRTRGMAMVEMVFVLPVLILIVFAIAQFGLMFSRWLTLSNAVREGAREGVAYRVNCNSGTVTTDVKNKVVAYARAGGVGISNSDVNVSNNTCQPAGTQVSVDATFNFNLNIPFFNSAPVPLKYSSTMRQE